MRTICLGILVALCGLDPLSAGPLVWDGADPEALPLDVEPIRHHKEGDVEIDVFRYTSEIWKEKPLRVLGMYGRPKGEGKFPAILHFHGGGQTASPRDIAECVRRGYACFSFDWTGPKTNRTEVTEWPKEIDSHYVPDKSNKLYHAVMAARRGITFLARRPEVDPTRIGEYGISWGGYCTWLLNGTDRRLKACVPVYGCGGLLADGRDARPVAADQVEAWSANFEPLRYGPLQRAPVLHVNGMNDFFGWVPAGRELLLSCPVPTRQVYTPGINHGVGPEAAAAAYAWLDHHLKDAPALPASPSIRIALGPAGVPQGTIVVDRANDAESVRVDYSIGNSFSPGRCWRAVPATKRRLFGGWQVALPIFDPAEQLHAIAQVKYRQGFRLSSVPEIVIPKDLGAAAATLRRTNLLSDFSDGIGGWSPVFQSTQLYDARQDVALDPHGFNGRPCLKVVPLLRPLDHFTITCWRPGDPQWNGGDATALRLWIRGAEKAVGLAATERVKMPGEKTFTALIPIKPEKGWQQVTVPRAQLRFTPAAQKSDKPAPEPLSSWRDVQLVQINGPVAPGEALLIGPAEWIP